MKSQPKYRAEFSHHRKLEPEEGFSDEDNEPIIVQNSSPQIPNQGMFKNTRTHKNRYREPKVKLKYLELNQSHQKSIQNSIMDQQLLHKRSVSKSLELRTKISKDSACHLKKNQLQPLFKTERALIGENLTIPRYALQDTKAIKSVITSLGQEIVFEAPKEINTHGFLRRIAFQKKTGLKKTFLNSKYNKLLKQKLKQSYITSKTPEKPSSFPKNIQFQNDLQSGNLQIVSKQADGEIYDIYLRNDTNTHGHQNWFYFSVTNSSHKPTSITINICNIKRDFSLINLGQKIFTRVVHSFKQAGSEPQWVNSGSNLTIKQNTNPKIARGRIFKLTFTLDLEPQTTYQVSLLPSYTYSKMLNFVEKIQEKNKRYVEVDILTYSLTGLAIPLITITDKEIAKDSKKVVLISCRIHPGETVSSFIVEGFIKKLLSLENADSRALIESVIFKIVPMINPDGVVYGNFRTNFLGVDMNRAFNSENQVINPEIVNLKELGRKLQKDYGNNFIYFFDLHGHSCQKNIFTYGPNFQYSDPNYYNARILPTILDNFSKYFDLQNCSFMIEEYKSFTARAFFFTEFRVMTYTVESSYAVFDDYSSYLDGKKSTIKLFEVDDWLSFGEDFLDALSLGFKLLRESKIKSHRELKKAIAELQQNRKQTSHNQNKNQIKKLSHKNNSASRPSIIDKIKEDSDGESEGEDLNDEERKQVEKKIHEVSIPNYLLPKVFKSPVVYPTVTPKLFELNQQQEAQNFKYLFTKRNKYNACKIVSKIEKSYFPDIYALDKLRPQVKNIKIASKSTFTSPSLY